MVLRQAGWEDGMRGERERKEVFGLTEKSTVRRREVLLMSAGLLT
jgi:hypothetical protein